MAAIAPLRQRLQVSSSSICSQCRRMLSTSAPLASGHNKWSKIKHQKGAADAQKMKERAALSHNIMRLTKLYGPNLAINTQLASFIAAAKKMGLPKATIETAIERGQGRSASGATLEPLTLEIMMPPSVALVVEVETDRKNHEMQTFNQLAKKHGGALGSTLYLFTRAGRVEYEMPAGDDAVTEDTIMDAAIENGAEDVEFWDEGADGNTAVVSTQPGRTTELVQALSEKLGLKAASADLVWAPNEFTRALVGDAHQYSQLVGLVEDLRAHPDVQAVYSNATQGEMGNEEWARLEENLDVT